MQPRNPITLPPFLNTFREAAESMFDLYEQQPNCYLEGIQMGIIARQWIKIYYMVVFILYPQALEVNSSNALRHHLVKHLKHRGQRNLVLEEEAEVEFWAKGRSFAVMPSAILNTCVDHSNKKDE